MTGGATELCLNESDRGARWRWPRYREGKLGALTAASFVEWRYYAVLAPAFRGMVGLALFNPERRFPMLAEGGLLLIVAGALGREGALGASGWPQNGFDAVGFHPADLCWMHLFAPGAWSFDRAGPGSLDAEDGRCRLRLRSPVPALAQLDVVTDGGLALQLSHQGTFGRELPPALDTRPDGHLGGLIDSHWQVTCPSPVARCDGVLRLAADALGGLADAPGAGTGSYASPALRDEVAHGGARFQWRGASGYAEHSFGVRPLPLQGWDFLFVPDAKTGQAVVLQTYRGSRVLRYLEVCWRQDGIERHHRFSGENLRLGWSEHTWDPVLGVRRPLRRRIEAHDAGLRLRLDNRVLHRVPLLRRHRLAVRHFFISEEIGVADWKLTDADGRLLAAGVAQPCGGELAHVRLRAPRVSA